MSKSPTIALLKKQETEIVCKAVLVKIFGDVIRFFNVGKSMNDNQLGELVGFVMKDYYFLKLTDLKVWSDGIKRGKYLSFSNGKLFDRLDGQIILMSLNEYDVEDRTFAASTMQVEKQGELMALQEADKNYVVQVSDFFLREGAEQFDAVDEREIATTYKLEDAMRIQKWVRGHDEYKETPEVVKIIDLKKATKSFFNHLAKEAPQLLTKQDRFKLATKGYHEQKKKIEADESLSEFEKYNRIRGLSGMVPLTESEFSEREELLKKTVEGQL